MNRTTIVALTAVLTLSTACAAATEQPAAQDTGTTPAPTATDAPVPAPFSSGYVEVVERVSPSVVTVQIGGGTGSGVVLRPDVIVTNAHVVGTAREVTIGYADGSSSPGAVLAADEITDLAVVRTARKDLPVPEYRPDLPRAGEVAIAIGSPLGFENSVTVGVISGLNRNIPGSAAQTSSLVDLIQTDASISPGNSGGALLDARGRVVGINEAYIPPAVGAVSLGFAIPTATVLDVAEQLLTTGRAVHPFLGVTPGRLTPAIQRALGVPTDNGALVRGVDPGSPAAAAGVRPGDVIVELAGTDVGSVEDLLGALRKTSPGSRETMVVARGDQRLDLTVTIGSRSG